MTVLHIYHHVNISLNYCQCSVKWQQHRPRHSSFFLHYLQILYPDNSTPEILTGNQIIYHQKLEAPGHTFLDIIHHPVIYLQHKSFRARILESGLWGAVLNKTQMDIVQNCESQILSKYLTQMSVNFSSNIMHSE